MQSLEFLPVPYVQINEQYEILFASPQAVEAFGPAATLLDLIDSESRPQVLARVTPQSGQGVVEVNARMRDMPLALCDLHQHWEPSGRGHVVLIHKDPHLLRIVDQLRQMQEHLRHGSVPPPVPPPVPARSSQADWDPLAMHLSTIRDLVRVVRPALLDAGKSAYADLLDRELDEAEGILQEKLPGD